MTPYLPQLKQFKKNDMFVYLSVELPMAWATILLGLKPCPTPRAVVFTFHGLIRK